MFQNRVVEILVYLIVGIVFVGLGLWSWSTTNVNYLVLFFLLAAFFFFAIFRPTSLP